MGEAQFSAEYGIGQAKLELFELLGDPTKASLMKSIKASIDPASTMNPGKVLLS
jgi:FAD/FMN-containing dehydrogenase